ncbi:hypothetical protein [Streptomyces sp. NRRL B-1347]|uniref:hypothetical protein n=1 Tax=Streptomyces sp. NRRL B-1347 TaxID=1476877 RepID=UPI000AC21B3C|nr:hypothetical protein [Streptomyces sp. NRRL B-1347]
MSEHQAEVAAQRAPGQDRCAERLEGAAAGRAAPAPACCKVSARRGLPGCKSVLVVVHTEVYGQWYGRRPHGIR